MGRGMYALPSKPSKIAAYARIVPSKTLNNLEVARESDKQQPALVMSSPKPVFNGNGQRSRYINNVRSNSTPSPPQFSPQHEEFVKYLSDSWNRVSRELENRTGRDGAYHYNVLRHRQVISIHTTQDHLLKRRMHRYCRKICMNYLRHNRLGALICICCIL
ncbi:uncharacterized protein LOC127866641 isoform X1 [Dreissena polymorpha]|uniref:uncharacterized protein LOC127866641 isoform X1 n=1 Tax=Dreissena polymorpha TaxID=45954 RepID=UPI002263CCE7|nr:uncharacterized protein LOC127866641 isoform X1 [Dreissena polymorpha]